MSVIKLNDGSTETIFDRWDLLNAVETHMGREAMRLLEDYLDQYEETIDGLEAELNEMKTEMEKLKEQHV